MFSRWRLHRQNFRQPFRQAARPTYHPALLLFDSLQDPTDYTSHIKMWVALVHTGCCRVDADLYQVSCLVCTFSARFFIFLCLQRRLTW
jgi:hypothetical protein